MTSTFTKVATPRGGNYWRSALPGPLLRRHLDDRAGTRFKSADVGGEQESGFEQAFSSLAYAYIKDKAPRLLDFIVGFQLVDRNEDNTKAMGIFGFKVGDQWLYAPVFFLNGDLKGHELLYIKKRDMFVPMKENWVNYLIAKKPHVLGEGSEKSTFQLGGRMPNLRALTRIPPKHAADAFLPVDVDSWAEPALPLVFALAGKQARALYPEAPAGAALNWPAVVANPVKAACAASAFDLNHFLANFPLLKTAFEKCYLAYPLIKLGFDRFYGPDFFTRMAEVERGRLDSLVTKAAHYPGCGMGRKKKRKKRAGDVFDEVYGCQQHGGDFTPSGARPAGSSIIGGYGPLHKRGAVEVVKAPRIDEDEPGTITEHKPELTDAERERLLRDQVLIRDPRKGEEVTVAYNTQVRQALVNPADTGIYEVLEKPGTFGRMLVVYQPHTHKGRQTFATLVRLEDGKGDWLNTHSSNVWAKDRYNVEEYRDWYAKRPRVDGDGALKKGNWYVLVGETGGGTAPFEVQEDYGGSAYKIEFRDFPQYGKGRPMYMPEVPRMGSDDQNLDRESWENNVKLRVLKAEGNSVRGTAGGTLLVPGNFRVLEVKGPPAEPDDEPGDTESTARKILELLPIPHEDISAQEQRTRWLNEGQEGSREHPIELGNLADVQLFIAKTASLLDLRDTGGGTVWVGTEQMAKQAALVDLVVRHGLREGQARLMLKEAEDRGRLGRRASFRLKYAQGYPGLQPGPDAPPHPPPDVGTEDSGRGDAVHAIYPQEDYLPVSELDSSQTDPGTYDPFYEPDENAMQVAQRAAQSGQKEVFDTSMISGLLKSVRQESQVQRYLGDLTKAVDKLGRILFMFYWHQEEFEDRYGKQDMPELEDSLRNAFETLGDVTLFLQEKTVQGGVGMDMGAGGVGKSEPNVDEASHS